MNRYPIIASLLVLHLVVGACSAHRTGNVLSQTKIIGYFKNGYVLDADNNVCGTYRNGYMFDNYSNVIGTYRNGYILNSNDCIIATYSNGYVMSIGKSKKSPK